MYQALLHYLFISIYCTYYIYFTSTRKRCNAGASFGGGASGTIFGPAGASNLSKMTAILAKRYFF